MLLVAFAVFTYVALDGFDLGIGMPVPVLPAGEDPGYDDE